jgi:hypothetical protein
MMAAGLGFKTFTTGEVLTAGDVNGYLMQGINVFASEAARNAAITSPQEGQFAYTKDNNSLWYYSGSAWVASGATGDIEGVTVTSPLTGGGTSGTVTVGILSGTTSNLGAVQLSDSVSSTSTTLAATANAVKTAYDLAAANTSPTSYGFTAGKNALINGAFDVNQRGFTSTTTNEAYGFDRWLIGSTNGTTTYTAQTFTPGTAPVAGYEGTNFARIATTGQGVNSLGVFIQRIENARTFAGQTVTVSFWAKAASGTPQISTNFLRNYGTGGSPSAAEYTNTAIKTTLSTSWARYSVTLAIPSVSGKTFGTTANTSYLALYQFVSDSLTPGSGSLGAQNITVDFWGMQVEAGSTATAFQTATGTIPGELAACQRYYFQDAVAILNTQQAVASTIVYSIYYLPVAMRANPTLTQTGASVGSSNTSATSYTYDATPASPNKVGFYITGGASTGQVYLYRPIQLSAEL